MSLTKIDNITRTGLWKAYNNKCFYCNKQLEWDELHIDHIIPESLSATSEFDELVRDYNLEANFNLNSLKNLVPAHSTCNLRKTNILLQKSTALFYLSLTENKLEKIYDEIDKIKKSKNRGYILSKIQIALEQNLLSVKEINTILKEDQLEKWNNQKIKLPSALEFIDEALDIFYLNTDFSHLYNKKLLFGGVYDFIELCNDDDKTIKISTLKEWMEATALGYYPLTNADIKMSSSASFLEDFIDAVKKAKFPKVSFLNDPWIDIDNLDMLSPKLICDPECKLDEHIDKGESIGDLIRKGIVKINESNFYKISLEFDYMETSLVEQFRADFNDDGIEDILVRGWTRAIGGSLGFGFTKILSKLSDKHLIEEI